MMDSWIFRTFFLGLGLCTGILGLAYMVAEQQVDKPAATPQRIAFTDIAGWQGDDHATAFAVFTRSCRRIADVENNRAASGKPSSDPNPFLTVCEAALAVEGTPDASAAQSFFEEHFLPYRYGPETTGLVTGYYEPDLQGSRTRSDRYKVPVYAVPDDLVQLYPDEERAKRNTELIAGREIHGKIEPYFDRREIEQGALDGRGLEILWLADPVDAFFMHIQGSGRVALAEGGHVRLGYAAKNGLPYTAIGGVLIERGNVARDKMSMETLRDWLADNPDKAAELMWENRSYIFFREITPDADAPGPIGAQGVHLTPGRSLAVDTSIHRVGTPVWVDAGDLDLHGDSGFHRLMIAQDTGSAIRGPQRGDIFWGSGAAAGDIAGETNHKARFTILLPRGTEPGV